VNQRREESYGTMAYMVAMYAIEYPPPTPPWPGPPSFPSSTITTPFLSLSPEDRELLHRIEEKLDELLARSAPESEQVEEIKRRVKEAMEKILK
jgi:hypothetical protein